MANNYSLFSTVLGDITQEEEAWIREDLQEYEEPDGDDEDFQARWAEEWCNEHELNPKANDPHDWPYFRWEWEKTKDDVSELLIYSEEGYNENHLISFIQRFLKKFRPDFTFMVEGAFTCSKMRPDEFGGWWLVITAKEVRGGSTSEAMREAAAEMEGKEICSHGNKLGECSACDVAGDLAYDAAREDSRRNF